MLGGNLLRAMRQAGVVAGKSGLAPTRRICGGEREARRTAPPFRGILSIDAQQSRPMVGGVR